jgi:hypothetical protein
MKSMVALELIIKDLEVRVSIAKGQLARHNSGEEKLTLLIKASTENSLEKHVPLLSKYKKMLKELEKFEKLDSYEHRRLRAEIQRKKYYKFNKIQNKSTKKIKFRENDERIEASMIIDELPAEIRLENIELYNMAYKNLEKYLLFDKEAQTELLKIQEEFNKLIKNFTDENIKSLELLNYMIPIVIFHLYILKKNIVENSSTIIEKKVEEVAFYPKYHDWWIEELWDSHLAYFSLYKWKNTITELCEEEGYKKAWEIIFNNWIFTKTLVNEKSQLAFEYQYAFDTLLQKYVGLESELDKNIVNNMKNKVAKFIKEEDLFLLIPKHKVLTHYLSYKLSYKNKA